MATSTAFFPCSDIALQWNVDVSNVNVPRDAARSELPQLLTVSFSSLFLATHQAIAWHCSQSLIWSKTDLLSRQHRKVNQRQWMPLCQFQRWPDGSTTGISRITNSLTYLNAHKNGDLEAITAR